MKPVAAAFGLWCAATGSVCAQDDWPVARAALSDVAAERIACMWETAPREGPEPYGMIYGEACWEADRAALVSCLDQEYRTWRGITEVLRSHVPGDWRARLVERGLTDTQIFMFETTGDWRSTAPSEGSSPCDSGAADPDMLDQCIFHAANEAGRLADLFQTMSGDDR